MTYRQPQLSRGFHSGKIDATREGRVHLKAINDDKTGVKTPSIINHASLITLQ